MPREWLALLVLASGRRFVWAEQLDVTVNPTGSVQTDPVESLRKEEDGRKAQGDEKAAAAAVAAAAARGGGVNQTHESVLALVKAGDLLQEMRAKYKPLDELLRDPHGIPRQLRMEAAVMDPNEAALKRLKKRIARVQRAYALAFEVVSSPVSVAPDHSSCRTRSLVQLSRVALT